MADNSNYQGWYEHKDADKSLLLMAHLKAAISKHPNDDHMSAVLDGDTMSGEAAVAAAHTKKANRQIFGLFIGMIKNPTLIMYLSENHSDKGLEATTYITGCFGAGDDMNKLHTVDNEYKQAERDGIPADATPDQMIDIITKMTNLHSSLESKKDEGFGITPQRHSRNLLRLVAKIDKVCAAQVQRLQDTGLLTNDTLKNVPKIAGMLDSIIRLVHSQAAEEAQVDDHKLKLMMVAKGASKEEIDLFFTRTRFGKKKSEAEMPPICPHCKLRHRGKCHTKQLVDGEIPEGWHDKDKEQRERIVKCAENIKPSCTQKLTLFKVLLGAAAATTAESASLFVDSMAAPKSPYQFICDRSLFVDVNPIAEPIQSFSGIKKPSH